jgi:hypothetical protein
MIKKNLFEFFNFFQIYAQISVMGTVNVTTGHAHVLQDGKVSTAPNKPVKTTVTTKENALMPNAYANLSIQVKTVHFSMAAKTTVTTTEVALTTHVHVNLDGQELIVPSKSV